MPAKNRKEKDMDEPNKMNILTIFKLSEYFLMDEKINKTKQTVTPFCMFTLCEACLCKLSLSEVFSEAHLQLCLQ